MFWRLDATNQQAGLAALQTLFNQWEICFSVVSSHTSLFMDFIVENDWFASFQVHLNTLITLLYIVGDYIHSFHTDISMCNSSENDCEQNLHSFNCAKMHVRIAKCNMRLQQFELVSSSRHLPKTKSTKLRYIYIFRNLSCKVSDVSTLNF